MSAVELKPPKSAAPGPYLGFSLQSVRLCHHLFKASDGDVVGIEAEDDVTVYRANGDLVLEQCKSALASNPISDRAEALWNTFANWADRCKEGLNPDKAFFDLYVTPVKAGPLVEALHAAITDESIADGLKRINALVDPKKPGVGCAPHVTRFLSQGDFVCAKIIRRFRLIVEPEPTEAVREQLRPTLPAETLDAFCQAAIGFAKEEADALLRKQLHAKLDARAFRKRFGAFARKHDLLGLLISSTPPPPTDQVEAVVVQKPIFVQQLQAVDCTEELLITAVSDYLRTVSDKIDWADEGRIVAESLDEFDEQLVREHKLARDEIEDTMAASTDAQRGRALYRRCSGKTLPLEGRALPSHFVSGAFNGLSEARRVGWHPNFKTLFPEDG
ncbi:ABC-three component system protein [Phenylobacterium sp.]|jgi:hypothetical protein|uniref:ABC-three component system protein n=1 Tax=Phenylobacterium sp. TaxID=1871053 RepID=UPI0035AE728A